MFRKMILILITSAICILLVTIFFLIPKPIRGEWDIDLFKIMDRHDNFIRFENGKIIQVIISDTNSETYKTQGEYKKAGWNRYHWVLNGKNMGIIDVGWINISITVHGEANTFKGKRRLIK